MSGPIWIQTVLTLMLFLKDFLENVDFEKNQQTTKTHEKLLRMQEPTSILVCLRAAKALVRLHRSVSFSEFSLLPYAILTLKAPITTAADDKFCNTFPSFKQK